MENNTEFLEAISSAPIETCEMNLYFLPNQLDEHPCPYRALWRAVITQALMDAGSNSNKLELKKLKAKAIAWFATSDADFIEVCIAANLNPAIVKQKALKAIKNGCKWRNNSNKKNVKLKKKQPKKINDYNFQKIVKCAN